MTLDFTVDAAAAAARYNIRPLLPASGGSLRQAVVSLGSAPDGLTQIARHGVVDALAIGGLRTDQCRVLEREVHGGGGVVLTDREGSRAVVMGPLATIGELPAKLSDWGPATEDLGRALAATLASRGSVSQPLVVGNRRLALDGGTLIMGIVNVTDDSFSGDGLGDDVAEAVQQARQMAAAGAGIIDVGGESTRPGAPPVAAEVETGRVVAAIRSIVAAVDIPVSVDTRRASVAAAALDAGAVVVNDTSGLADPGMPDVVQTHGAGLVITHHSARPGVDLLEDIARHLRDRIAAAIAGGVAPERIVIDPGFGLGKNVPANVELMRRIGELRGIGRPLLLSPSRRPTISALGGGSGTAERLEGTVALTVLAAAAGVEIVRVHDVAPVQRALSVTDAIVRG